MKFFVQISKNEMIPTIVRFAILHEFGHISSGDFEVDKPSDCRLVDQERKADDFAIAELTRTKFVEDRIEATSKFVQWIVFSMVINEADLSTGDPTKTNQQRLTTELFGWVNPANAAPEIRSDPFAQALLAQIAPHEAELRSAAPCKG
jgi:hypothetical protein